MRITYFHQEIEQSCRFLLLFHSLCRSQIDETPGTIPLPTNDSKNPLGLAALIASPLSRAAESAQILADEIGFPKNQIIYDDRVKEWNAGEVQGKTLLIPI